jgi:hypothetical protein
MKGRKDNTLYAFTGGKATVYKDGRVKFSGEDTLYGDAYIRIKKFSNKKDAVLTLLNAGWYYKR